MKLTNQPQGETKWFSPSLHGDRAIGPPTLAGRKGRARDPHTRAQGIDLDLGFHVSWRLPEEAVRSDLLVTPFAVSDTGKGQVASHKPAHRLARPGKVHVCWGVGGIQGVSAIISQASPPCKKEHLETQHPF